MKNNSSKLKTTARLLLFITAVAVTSLTISSFKPSEKIITPGEGDGETIRDRAAAKQMYGDFLRQYPEATFAEHGGSISKATLEALLSKMTNEADTKVLYIFGRTADNKNCIMLFNNPAYNDLSRTPAYRTAAPYCPNDCDAALMQYLTE